VLPPDILQEDDLHDCSSELYEESYSDVIDDPSLEYIFNTNYIFKFNYSTELLSARASVVILDTAAGESLFCNRHLLIDVVESGDTVKFEGVDRQGTGIFTCTEGTTIFGNVMYSKRSMGNILSFGNVVDHCYNVAYDSDRDMFLVRPTKDGDIYLFARDVSTNIYVCDLENVLSAGNVTVPIGVTTVADQLKKYTRREVKKAALARDYLKNSDYMSAGQLIRAINLGKIKNCEVSTQDVLRGIDIWGKDLGNLKGKTTARKIRGADPTVHPDLPLVVAAVQDMNIDLMFVNGITYMIALFKPLDLAVAKRLRAHNQYEQWRVLQLLSRHVTKGNIKIRKILCDGESAIHSDYINSRLPEGVDIEDVDNVNDVERKIRTVKERMRAVMNTLPFQLCIFLEDWLLQSALYYLSFQPTVNSIDGRSPREQLLGVTLDAKSDLRFGFGDYCQICDNDTDNSMDERTTGAIALMPVGNSTGSWWFMVLMTRKAVRRDNAVRLPMPDWVISYLNDLAKKDSGRKRVKDGEILSISRGYANNYVDDGLDGGDDPGDVIQDQLPAVIQPQYEEMPVLHGIEDNDDENDIEDYADVLAADDFLEDDNPNQQQMNHAELLRDIFGDDSDADEGVIVPDAEQVAPAAMAEEPVHEQPVAEPEEAQRYNLRPRQHANEFWRGAAVTVSSKRRYVSGAAAGVSRQHFNKERNQFLKRKFAMNMTVQQGLDKLGQEALVSVAKEMLQVHDKDVFDPMKCEEMTPEQLKLIITSKTFLKDKYTAQGLFDKLKARLVAGGHLQDREIYDKGSSPTVSTQATFTVAGIAASEGRAVATVDFPGAFLNSEIPDDSPPVLVKLGKIETKILCKIDPMYKEFVRPDGTMVVKLKRALYGCVESGRLWYDKLSRDLIALGYEKNPADECVFNRIEADGKQTTLIIHVDDMMITATTEARLDEIIEQIQRLYPNLSINRGKKLDYLGMTFDFTATGKVKITMSGYVSDLLKECEDIAGTAQTPAASDLFEIDPKAELLGKAEKELYHSRTAKLLYLGKRVRPDLLTTTSFLTKRVTAPTVQDMRKLQRAVRYIRETKDKGIVIEGDKNLSILAYVDASYGVHHDYKSHTGCVIGIGRGPVYAKSSGQKINTKSSSEAELVGLSDSVGQVIWTRNFLVGQGYNVGPATIYQDNQSAIALVKSGKSNSHRTRHIAIRYFFIKDRVESKEIRIEYMRTGEMLADILTKPLQGDLFRRLRDELLNWYE
jgi:Reverse transcriptase (RNA-dependent DNA polymerase)